jgi:hypothetical protein
VQWQVTKDGIAIDGQPPQGTPGEPETVRRVLEDFGDAIRHWSTTLSVPAELIVATVCTESSGRPEAMREEPGFVSDAATPHRVSAGLMQTLISTAQETLAMPQIDRSWLLDPDNAIRAGTAYIARQARTTAFDPPVVACAYNAGSVYENRGAANRWRMRQYPIGTGHHADRFAAWFNDCTRVLGEHEAAGRAEWIPLVSFYRLLRV